MKVFRCKRPKGGFTLLEIMVSVAILAMAIVPLLLIRERSYTCALYSHSLRKAQEFAQLQLGKIALEVRTGEGSGSFEGWENYTFEYKVSLYDFGGGMLAGDEDYDPFGENTGPGDSVFPEDDEETFGPMVMRHVELTIFFPSVREEEEDLINEYVIDTYIPVLLTEEQYQNKLDSMTGGE
jgi:prepilin-type N-terminal cleavage/methylation domain-containing protein